MFIDCLVNLCTRDIEPAQVCRQDLVLALD
jgi:hypothetical protein